MEGSRRVLCLQGIEHSIQAYAQQQESVACAQQSMAFDSSSTECLQCPSAGRKSRGKERHQKQQHQQQQLRASLRRQEEKTAAAGIIRRRGKQQRQLHQPLRSLNVHDCCAHAIDSCCCAYAWIQCSIPRRHNTRLLPSTSSPHPAAPRPGEHCDAANLQDQTAEPRESSGGGVVGSGPGGRSVRRLAM